MISTKCNTEQFQLYSNSFKVKLLFHQFTNTINKYNFCFKIFKWKIKKCQDVDAQKPPKDAKHKNVFLSNVLNSALLNTQERLELDA